MSRFRSLLTMVIAPAAIVLMGTTPAFAATAPLAPTSVTATYVAADAEVDVAWVDASTDETSFVLERCQGTACTSFTQLTT